MPRRTEPSVNNAMERVLQGMLSVVSFARRIPRLSPGMRVCVPTFYLWTQAARRW